MQMRRVWPRKSDNSFLYKTKNTKNFWRIEHFIFIVLLLLSYCSKDLDKIECILNDGCILITHIIVEVDAQILIG